MATENAQSLEQMARQIWRVETDAQAYGETYNTFNLLFGSDHEGLSRMAKLHADLKPSTDAIVEFEIKIHKGYVSKTLYIDITSDIGKDDKRSFYKNELTRPEKTHPNIMHTLTEDKLLKEIAGKVKSGEIHFEAFEAK